jgi:hypothetical protein
MSGTGVHHNGLGSTTMSLKDGEKISREEVEMSTVSDLEAAREQSTEGKLTEENGPEDPFLVEWKENDTENPLNFKKTKKVLLMTMIAAIAFLTYLPTR